MDISRIMFVARKVLSDIRLIGACAAVLIYVNFVFYVARYRKKKSASHKKSLVHIQSDSQNAASDAADAEQSAASAEENSDAADDFIV